MPRKSEQFATPPPPLLLRGVARENSKCSDPIPLRDSHTDERRVRASKALHGASPRSQRRVRFASSESGGKA